MKNLTFALVGAGLAFLSAGCLSDSDKAVPPSGSLGGMTVNNDEKSLSDRVTDRNDTLEIDTSGQGATSKRAATKTLTLTLIAEIAPPELKGGAKLQASSVVLKGDFAYVSYNRQGNAYGGAVDVIQIKSGKNAELRSQVVFDSTDVHALHYDGTLWLAESQLGSDFPARLEKFEVSGGKIVLPKARQQVQLGSFAANSVVTYGKRVYVTTGNTGSVYTLDADLKKLDSVSLSDARWVDVDALGLNMVVARGGTPITGTTQGSISVYGLSALLNQGKTYTVGGSTIAESKGTVRVVGGKALVAAGDGGIKLVNISNGSVVGSVPRTKVTGLDSGLTVTNAADASGDLVYASNGEAGIYAYAASSNLDVNLGNLAVTLSAIGKLKFAEAVSANHVAFDGNTLVVAAGLGGVKIVSVKWE